MVSFVRTQCEMLTDRLLIIKNLQSFKVTEDFAQYCTYIYLQHDSF